MKLDNRWILLLVVAARAAAGIVVASRSRRQNSRSARAREHKSQIRAWENEGGNLAPSPTASALQ